MQLPHYVKVPSQTIEALKTEHRMRILHGHRVFDQKNRPAIDKIDYLSISGILELFTSLQLRVE